MSNFNYDFIKFNFSIITKDFLKLNDDISIIIIMLIFLEYSLNTAKIIAKYYRRDYINSNDFKNGLKYQAINFHLLKNKIIFIFNEWKNLIIKKNDTFSILNILNENVLKLIQFIDKDNYNEKNNNELIIPIDSYPPKLIMNSNENNYIHYSKDEKYKNKHENPKNILYNIKKWKYWNPSNYQSIILKSIVCHLID
jgi:hypothetical protein